MLSIWAVSPFKCSCEDCAFHYGVEFNKMFDPLSPADDPQNSAPGSPLPHTGSDYADLEYEIPELPLMQGGGCPCSECLPKCMCKACINKRRHDGLPLPTVANADGRPVWEPPILDYSDLIDEEYHKKRKAMLEYTNGIVAKATEYMDTGAEIELFRRYIIWALDQEDAVLDSAAKKFFHDLSYELRVDFVDVMREARVHFGGGLEFTEAADDTYIVEKAVEVDKRKQRQWIPMEVSNLARPSIFAFGYHGCWSRLVADDESIPLALRICSLRRCDRYEQPWLQLDGLSDEEAELRDGKHVNVEVD